MTSYDEDIFENPFHHHLLKNHPDLLEAISEKNWILCIPRKGTLDKTLTRRDIYDHVLVAEGNSYRNLNDLIISPATNDCLTFNGSSTKILFKETFYTKHMKYRIFCIDVPINIASTDMKIVHLSNLKDCIDFLIEESSCEILNKINETCEAFLLEHESLHNNSLQDLKDLAQMLYTRCILLSVKGNFIRQNSSDRVLAFNFRVAIETYMQHCLNNQIFNAVCTNTSLEDGKLNKRTRNLQNVQLSDLGVVKFQDTISEAASEILKLNRCTTTMAKLMCLKNVFRIFSHKKLNAEDLVQLFTYLIIKSNVNNWIANLTCLQRFVFASADSSNENAFLITTLEAAIEYILSNILHESDFGTSQNKLFESIRTCDMESIEIILQKDDPTIKYTLCHPLCTCDNCETALVSSNKYTLNWCDEKGRSAMHIACLYGNPLPVDCFMRKNADITSVDYAGWTPCHYAANYGHQNALLLLLHAGADSNVVDCEGNTPLHLACNNCHENCVKALLYYAEHKNYQVGVNRQNLSGDTALHLATRWGYINLIAILLQYSANYKLKNKKGKRAIDLTNNYNIKRIITEKKQDNNFPEESKSTEQLKKVDLLLRAVENNDLPLTCFYLGIPVPSSTKETQKQCCHPLCNCELNSLNVQTNLECNSAQKININASNSEGITALHVAAKFGRKEILRLLLDAGANVNLRTLKFSYTPLHLACINQRANIIKDLLLCGSCNIDVQDYKGNTPLHHGCFKNNSRIVELLLLQGSDVAIRNDDARTALQVAEDMSLTNVFKIIKDKSNAAILIDD